MGFGKARCPAVFETPTTFSARDEFDQSAGALTATARLARRPDGRGYEFEVAPIFSTVPGAQPLLGREEFVRAPSRGRSARRPGCSASSLPSWRSASSRATGRDLRSGFLPSWQSWDCRP
jgi:hypothetical protein